MASPSCFANGQSAVSMGVARIFQRGGHTDSYRGYSSDCHLNIVGCLLTKRLTKGGGVTGTPGPPWLRPWLATQLVGESTGYPLKAFKEVGLKLFDTVRHCKKVDKNLC